MGMAMFNYYKLRRGGGNVSKRSVTAMKFLAADWVTVGFEFLFIKQLAKLRTEYEIKYLDHLSDP